MFGTGTGIGKSAGDFSKRHKTSEAHTKAQARRLAREEEQIEARYQRDAEATQRSPQEQLKRLNAKFGIGKGATKERKRLMGYVSASKG